MKKKYRYNEKVVLFLLLPIIAFLIEIIGSDYNLSFILSARFFRLFSITFIEVIIAWLGIRTIIFYVDKRTFADNWNKKKRFLHLTLFNLIWYITLRVSIFYFETLVLDMNYDSRILINSGIPVEILFLIFINLVYFYWRQQSINQVLNSRYLSNSNPAVKPKPLELKIAKKTIFVNPEDIAYAYLHNSITHIVTSKNDIHKIDYSLNTLQVLIISQNPFRINRQFLVNRSAIDSFQVLPTRQLQISLRPVCEKTCLLNKNNVKKFKTWLQADVQGSSLTQIYR